MKLVLPLDPECPSVNHFMTGLEEDPMTKASGVGDEVADGWADLHRDGCSRCQEYGVANIGAEQ